MPGMISLDYQPTGILAALGSGGAQGAEAGRDRYAGTGSQGSAAHEVPNGIKQLYLAAGRCAGPMYGGGGGVEIDADRGSVAGLSGAGAVAEARYVVSLLAVVLTGKDPNAQLTPSPASTSRSSSTRRSSRSFRSTCQP